jgi:hypothetical protein
MLVITAFAELISALTPSLLKKRGWGVKRRVKTPGNGN